MAYIIVKWIIAIAEDMLREEKQGLRYITMSQD